MVQLRVESDSGYVWLDLYETEPIKLTLSIEDITDTSARSVFSRSFRLPSTGNNNKFFKHAFMIEGVDFDVTVRKAATVLVDGNEFRSGHVRLQKIYRNKSKDSIEYEIVFMGETRDFATALSDKKLKDLDLSSYDHDLNYTNIVNSWQAYPEGGLTDGLFNGDILYPLVDFGDREGEPRVKYSKSQNGGGFNFSANALTPTFFRPMIRAKALWDKIFEESGFTYTSNIANDPGFTQLYVSAWGNDPDNVVEVDGSANTLDVGLTDDYFISGTDTILWDNEILDPNDNYNPLTGIYTVPETTVANNYIVNVIVDGNTRGEAGGGSVRVSLFVNTVEVDFTTHTIPINTDRRWYSSMSIDQALTAGDQIKIVVEESGDVDRTLIHTGSYMRIPQAEGDVGIAVFFDDEYKQIDFIKDMITKFRLVMAPDVNNDKNFIIDPWVNYIGSGDLFDWTDKVDHSRDLQIEPIFFSQTDRLEFKDKEDKDFINERNVAKYKETFGTLKFDSGNDLLIGSRDITTGFAPTPLSQIDGAKDSNFLLPKIYSVETEAVDEDNQGETITEFVREPIKPVTRLLFYNGLMTQTGTDDFGVAVGSWYLENGVATAQNSFPMISYWQTFDATTGPADDTINLNWQIERGYAYDFASVDFTKGVGMFDQFWAEYIANIYNKFARRLTCYVVLEPVDLQRLSFDDVIFIDGTYYRPEKIMDAVVGQKSIVKVELIKLLNYQLVQPEPLGELVGVDDGIGDGGGSPVDGGGSTPTATNRVYELQSCANPGDPIYASYTSVDALNIGQAVKTTYDGSVSCYEVQSISTISPNATVTGVFDDCASCS